MYIAIQIHIKCNNTIYISMLSLTPHSDNPYELMFYVSKPNSPVSVLSVVTHLPPQLDIDQLWRVLTDSQHNVTLEIEIGENIRKLIYFLL